MDSETLYLKPNRHATASETTNNGTTGRSEQQETPCKPSATSRRGKPERIKRDNPCNLW